MEDSVQELIIGCINQNRSSQERLYRLHSAMLFKTCRLYAQDEQEAADFLHDAFIHVFKNIHLFQQHINLEAWLRKVTVNCCLQQLRLKKRLVEVPLVPEKIAFYDSAEEEEEKRVDFGKVLEEINKLPTKAGLVIKLYAIEGWSHIEIAEELNISVGTSKSQLSYARSLIKSRFL